MFTFKLNKKERKLALQTLLYNKIIELNGKIIMLYCGNYFGKTGFGYAELEIN